MSRIDIKDCELKFVAGDSEELVIKVGEGNISWSEKVNREYMLDRGLLDAVRDGDEEPCEFSMDIAYVYYSGGVDSANDVSPDDFVKQIGGASAYTSTDSDLCNPYAIDIVLTHSPNPGTCGDIEILTWTDFRYESIDHDVRAGTISMSGKCNQTKPVATRVASSSGA